MLKHNSDNERIKHKYFSFLKEAMRQSEPTIDGVAKALARFEGLKLTINTETSRLLGMNKPLALRSISLSKRITKKI